MVQRSYRPRILDILNEIALIEQMLAHRDLAAYENDLAVKRATERCLEIISEASRHIPDDVQAQFPEIPWPRVRAIGNVLRHEYGRVEDALLWTLTQDSLPALKVAMTRILAELPDDGDG